MLKISGISKSFGARRVLDGVSLVVNDGEVAGIVGPNGAGKSTLLAVVAGALAPDGGSCAIHGPIGYLRQGHARDGEAQIGDVFPRAFAAFEQDSRLQSLADQIAYETDAHTREDIEREYERALGEVEHASEGVLEQSSRALGVRAFSPHERVRSLSGGELTKLGLIDIVAGHPNVLVLDEPTNSLDLEGLAWLDAYLRSFSGPTLLVSHDRALLDDHATQIVEIDPAMGQAESYAGNFSRYAKEKARRREEMWDRYRRQREREQRTEREIRSIKATAQRREHVTQNDFYRRKAKKVARRAVVLERRLRREAGAPEHVDKPIRQPYGVKADFAHADRSGERMLVARALDVSAADRVLVRAAELTIGWGERVVLLGRNGSGKTSLLRALMRDDDGGDGAVRVSPSTRVGYLAQSEPVEAGAAGAADDRTAIDVIRVSAGISETEARRHLHRFLFESDEALTAVSRLSYGERRRLSLAQLVVSGVNLLILDEPTNHLDIPSREAFEQALEAYEGALLAVTHDRFFIERFGERLLSIEDGQLVEVP